jgi:lysophospholipase L1-like esterase
MKASIFAFGVIALLAPSVSAQVPAGHRPITEKIEWTWADRPKSPDPELPNVLLLGDSITRDYYPATAKALQGVANVYLFATSACAADPRYVGQLRDYWYLAGVKFRVIHFNNGMHGWGYSDEQYAASLPSIITALRKQQPQARLVWANTTPVRVDSDGATNERIERRNRDADLWMKRFSVSIDDQYALMKPHEDLHQDNVHWNENGSQLQSVQVTDSVRKSLGGR